MKTQPIRAYHFLPADCRLAYDDDREVKVGEAVTHKGRLALCESGLHASRSICDALSFRRGPVLTVVDCYGVADESNDKLVCRRRKCVWMADLTPILRQFALSCAKHVLPLFEQQFPDDKRVRVCIETTERWLAGEATQAELNEARRAAYTAYDAAYAAYAAYGADAADAAAAYTAYAAADAAADAAYDADAAERTWQETELLHLIRQAHPDFPQ